MVNALEEVERYFRWRRIRCCIFIISGLLLYITNLVVRSFVFGNGMVTLLKDFLLPVALANVVYAVDQRTGWSRKMRFTRLRQVKMSALCVSAVAAFLLIAFANIYGEVSDLVIAFLALFSMCVAPYAFETVQKTAAVIICDAVLFIILAAKFGGNPAAIIMIAGCAFALIHCLPLVSRKHKQEVYAKEKAMAASLTLFAVLLVVLFIEETKVFDAFYYADKGKTGIDAFLFADQHCAEIIKNARLLGSVPPEFHYGIFACGRVFIYILAVAGWLAVIPLILALLLMIVSGFSLLRKLFSIDCLFAAAFLTMIIIQTAGYFGMCAGFNQFLFPSVCPFLDGEFCENLLFLVAALCILPRKPIKSR